ERHVVHQEQLERLAPGARGEQLEAVAAQQGLERDEVLVEIVDQEDLDGELVHRTCSRFESAATSPSSDATCASGTAASAAAGMMLHSAVAGSCTNVRPPRSCTARSPRAPSLLA